MEVIIQEIDVEELTSIFNIPEEMRNSRVEVTIRPIEKTTWEPTAEKIEQFRKKYNNGTFTEQLRKGVAEGRPFDFDVQKVIDGTENEEEKQVRYRLEKQTWGKLTQGKMLRGGV